MAFFPMKGCERSLDIYKIVGKLVLEGKEQFDNDVYDAKEKGNSLASSIGKGLATAAKVGAAAIGVASTAIGTLTKSAIENYADYEQLVGGAELLFGDAYDYIAEKAKNAYSTVQMSQNEYLEQVNGFATGLKTALGGDEQAAAELADRIITAEADIVAATGNSQEAVQNAFNGIMKSNFTMLDNLQLGITPTKEGFQEVIDKVNEWNKANGNATKYQIDNLADCQSALLDYIKMQGLSGYASMEASKTISGSVASMKSAWSNLVTGIADENANMEDLINNFVGTLVGDENGEGGVINNILPRIEQSLEGVGLLVDTMIPIIVDKVPTIVEKWLPKILQSGVSMVQTILDGMMQNQGSMVEGAVQTILTLINGIIDMLPDILVTGTVLIGELIAGLFQALPDILARIPEIIVEIANAFAENSGVFLEIGKSIVSGIWDGICSLWNSLTENMSWLVNGLTAGASAAAGVGYGDALVGNVNGSHADGLSYVPFDGYIAELHRGERVLTASEARNYNSQYDDKPIKIIVQSVLDGKVIGETAYEYSRQKARAGGI